MSLLFAPLQLRELTIPNRVWMAPMCQYSATDGVPDDWHLTHLGARAVGGAGLLLTEATAVVPEGRISPGDTGLWNDTQVAAWRRITDFVHGVGGLIGTQLAHAGRKGSVHAPWQGPGAVAADAGGWTPVGPTGKGFPGLHPAPLALSAEDVSRVVDAFAAATRRAVEAGFDVVEVHAAHGYLLHEFLSPLVNTRTDAWGGSWENRARLTLDVVEAVRAEWPAERPLLVRVSGTDWTPGGWTTEDTARLAPLLAERGADLVDCSSGGAVAGADIPVAPGYQVPIARAVRAAGVPSGAVGLITDPAQAERILADGDADVVLLARELLRDPYWPQRAAAILGGSAAVPVQYERAHAGRAPAGSR
jgi:2,4-dienoyl-CoA reductase-like NADH-dependent reductase (Old Yellow Enzyme family)